MCMYILSGACPSEWSSSNGPAMIHMLALCGWLRRARRVLQGGHESQWQLCQSFSHGTILVLRGWRTRRDWRVGSARKDPGAHPLMLPVATRLGPGHQWQQWPPVCIDTRAQFPDHCNSSLTVRSEVTQFISFIPHRYGIDFQHLYIKFTTRAIPHRAHTGQPATTVPT